MKEKRYNISIISLDTPVPNMQNWDIAKLKRWYKKTMSLRNQEAVFKELQRRDFAWTEINDMLQ